MVLFNHNGTTSDELSFNKGEYLIVTNWDAGDGYAYGYKRNDPQQRGKFPSPLVRKVSENNGMDFFLFINLNFYRIFKIFNEYMKINIKFKNN